MVRRKKIAIIILSFVLAIIVICGFLYVNLSSKINNINSVEDLVSMPTVKPNPGSITNMPVEPTPAPTNVEIPVDSFAGDNLNLLLIGSDSRESKNRETAKHNTGNYDARSDTVILLSISGDRKEASLISLPRDSMVNIPTCIGTNGKESKARFGMLNSAFSLGYGLGGDLESAIACTWNTIQHTTGIEIDGAFLVDFYGFSEIIDTIGGIELCFDEDFIGQGTAANFTKGCHTLNGEQALAYTRTRKGKGLDGSDIARTERQQEFLKATISKILEDETLKDLTKIYSLISSVFDHLIVSDNFSNLNEIASLAYSMRGLNMDNIHTMTIPHVPYPKDKNRVEWTSEAYDIFDSLESGSSIRYYTNKQ